MQDHSSFDTFPCVFFLGRGRVCLRWSSPMFCVVHFVLLQSPGGQPNQCRRERSLPRPAIAGETVRSPISLILTQYSRPPAFIKLLRWCRSSDEVCCFIGRGWDNAAAVGMRAVILLDHSKQTVHYKSNMAAWWLCDWMCESGFWREICEKENFRPLYLF